jgi:hypothetical protein
LQPEPLRTNRRFEFQKRSQPFVGTHNETLTSAAMCVGNPDCSPATIEPMGKSDSSVTFRGLRT